MTLHPCILAIYTAYSPTPPAAEDIRTVSVDFNLQMSYNP
jgi:hypothetical protein